MVRGKSAITGHFTFRKLSVYQSLIPIVFPMNPYKSPINPYILPEPNPVPIHWSP